MIKVGPNKIENYSTKTSLFSFTHVKTNVTKKNKLQFPNQLNRTLNKLLDV